MRYLCSFLSANDKVVLCGVRLVWTAFPGGVSSDLEARPGVCRRPHLHPCASCNLGNVCLSVCLSVCVGPSVCVCGTVCRLSVFVRVLFCCRMLRSALRDREVLLGFWRVLWDFSQNSPAFLADVS